MQTVFIENEISFEILKLEFACQFSIFKVREEANMSRFASMCFKVNFEKIFMDLFVS